MAKFDLKKVTSMAKDLVDKSGDKIASGVDKATDKIDEKTKGKYRDKLDKVDAAAQKLDKTAKDADADADAVAADGGEPTAASDAPDDGQPADPTPAADQPTSFPEPS
jgi:hypothetical protein